MKDGSHQITVFETERVRAVCHNPDRARLSVSFDYLRRTREGFPGKPPSQRFLAAGHAHLIVETAQNDWFLSPDLPKLRGALHDFTAGFDDVAAMGFSLGGYGALLMSRALHLRRVLLVSPQYSIFAAKVPFERRYRKYAAVLDPELDDIVAQGNAELAGAVLFDPLLHPNDALHAALVREAFPGLQAVAMPFGGHPALGLINEAKLFGKVQALMTEPEISAQAVHMLRRRARSATPGYFKRVQKYLKRREAAAAQAPDD
jgi:hypothetical protein